MTAISVRLAAEAKSSEKADRSFSGNGADDEVDLVGDREVFLKYFAQIFALAFDFLQHLLEGADQIKNAHFRL